MPWGVFSHCDALTMSCTSARHEAIECGTEYAGSLRLLERPNRPNRRLRRGWRAVSPRLGTVAALSSPRVPGGVVHKLPTDPRGALTANRTALDAWKDITPLARNEFICWVEDAKQAITRERRIRRTQEELEEGQRRPCCWPGCKHRERTGKERRNAPGVARLRLEYLSSHATSTPYPSGSRTFTET